MRIFTFVFILFISAITLKAHTVTVSVEQYSKSSAVSWKILDSSQQQILVSSDTVSGSFFIQADKRYFFQIHIDSISENDTALYQVSVGYVPIMYFGTDLTKGNHSYPFFTYYETPELRIIGGSETTIDDFPWQVYMRSDIYMCGGIIISPKWILTAAHCTKDSNNVAIPASKMYVKVGATNPYNSSKGKIYYIKSYTAHVDYDTLTLVNDLALLELEEEIDFENAEAIKLITEEEVNNGATDPGVMATVTGWGITDAYNITFPDNLQKVELPIVSNSVAAQAYGEIFDASILMAGYAFGGKDACGGDSGGPLVVEVDGKKKLAGVVSFGKSFCNSYGGYTRVSSHLDWIRDIAKIANDLSNPAGDKTICNTETSTQYTTDSIYANYYQWQISPDTAASLQFTNQICNVNWDTAFYGEATLKVRANIDSSFTPWAEYTVDRVYDTRLVSNSNDTSLCEGNNLALYTKAEGENLAYNWYLDDEFQLSTYNGIFYIPEIDTLESGMYFCEIDGTCGTAKTDNINIKVIPTTKITSVFEDRVLPAGSSEEFIVNSVGENISYQWYKDDNLIEGEQNATLSITDLNANDIGLYRVAVTGTCESDTSNVFYIYVSRATDSEPQAKIWPTISVNSISVAVKQGNPYSIQVIDMQGKKVFERDNLSYLTELDLSSLAQGIYILIVESEGVKESQRIFLY